VIKKLSSSDIHWRDGVPIAPEFDDVYYSLENGLEESDFVFLEGTNAPECWKNKAHFTIAETGFGTGLNFLATYRKWMESGANGRLTYISVEGFPISQKSLEKAHQAFPELSYFSNQLRAAWPPPSPGFHPRYFENGKIQLLLLFGEATSCFSELVAEVDAWFLDGFAPAKNPAMWSDALFDEIARLSKPGTRFATFTAAGFVKRALAERGFEVSKTKGYGRKRERLVGIMAKDHIPYQPKNKPEWAALGKGQGGPTTIIGAGIAGRSLAAALKRRGVASTLIAGEKSSASTVPAAILAPGFQAGLQPTSDFVTSGFSHACWLPDYADAWSSARGVELFASTKEEKSRFTRIKTLLNWSEDWIRDTENGLFYPRAGSLDSSAALDAIYSPHNINYDTITAIEKTSVGWALIGQNNTIETANLVISAGAETQKLLHNAHHIGFTARAGQIEQIVECQTNIPNQNLSANGYVTASLNGMQTLGSTFSDYAEGSPDIPSPSLSATKEILEKLQKDFAIGLPEAAILTSWTGVRAATGDYMPVIGPVPNWEAAAEQFSLLSKDRKTTGLGPMPYQDGLYLLSGFGSKGFQQAPYAAEYLAAHLCGDPLPMAQSVAAYLHPARAFIRKIIRGGRR